MVHVHVLYLYQLHQYLTSIQALPYLINQGESQPYEYEANAIVKYVYALGSASKGSRSDCLESG